MGALMLLPRPACARVDRSRHYCHRVRYPAWPTRGGIQRADHGAPAGHVKRPHVQGVPRPRRRGRHAPPEARLQGHGCRRAMPAAAGRAVAEAALQRTGRLAQRRRATGAEREEKVPGGLRRVRAAVSAHVPAGRALARLAPGHPRAAAGLLRGRRAGDGACVPRAQAGRRVARLRRLSPLL